MKMTGDAGAELSFYQSVTNFSTYVGWGKTELGSTSDVLVEVTLPFVTNEVCAQTYGPFGIDIRDSHICAGGKNESDACEGDSGGPLQTYGLIGGKIRMIQYGIVAS